MCLEQNGYYARLLLLYRMHERRLPEIIVMVYRRARTKQQRGHFGVAVTACLSQQASPALIGFINVHAAVQDSA